MKKIAADSREMNVYWKAYVDGAMIDHCDKYGSLHYEKNENGKYELSGKTPTQVMIKLNEITGHDFTEHDNYWEFEKVFNGLYTRAWKAFRDDLNTYGVSKNHSITRVRIFNKKRVEITFNIVNDNGVIKTSYTLIADGVKLI